MEINDYVTGIISITAIVISIIAYIQNSRIEKRQLRIEKLEEMLEITHILVGNYQYFEDTNHFKNDIISETKNESEKEKYLRQVKVLREVSENIDLQNKLTRLFVLNNSYLPKKELKEKIGTFIAVYTSIAENILTNPHKIIKLPFNDFPKRWDFLDFTQEIQNELITEMDLGYKDSIDNKNTYVKKFKERYKLK
ncbi:hypothetical protein [Tenacibaculum caenipelagi]|uniref:Uncharacterized protein n=1 Tax=Tenacibaculum caenipelagi TaxID=1325435 RepID=A0A4R6TGS5_9FLAO|nr:hypothetical protein [Tenacibaculum caenipelagi]TDQ28400.1 hypothetical protein DFQ07_0770 [Tenacibaculum caenipelagi]